MSIIIGLLIFGLIVLIHELGHFWAAKLNNIYVIEFAIGMGPKIFSFKKNGTIYSLRLFPIGGSCQMLGEEDELEDSDLNLELESDLKLDKNFLEKHMSFNNKPVINRIIVVIAGVFMNLLLAFIISLLIIICEGASLNRVSDVLENSPAHEKIMTGDIIYEINNKKINISQEINFYVNDLIGLNKNKNKILDLKVKRDKEIVNLKLEPVFDEKNNIYYLGIEKDFKLGWFEKDKDLNLEYEKINLLEAVKIAYYNIIFYVKLSLIGLGRLLTRKLSFKEVSGPVGIVKVIGQAYNSYKKESFSLVLSTLLNFTAMISANIGVFNLLPVPALDGGKLFFLLIELITRKRINSKLENLFNILGFAVLILIAILVTISDIIKLW